MIDTIADHRTQETKVIGAGGDVGEKLADRDAALAVLLELPWRLHQTADVVLPEGESSFKRHRFAVIFVQARFGIECIDTRRTAVHEKEDDALDSRRQMRRLGR